MKRRLIFCNLLVLASFLVVPALCAPNQDTPKHPTYRQRAEQQTAWIQAHYYDPATGKYHGDYPVNPKGLPWALMWANGVQVRVLAEATQAEPAEYRPILHAYGNALMQDYWDPTPKGSPPGFNAYCSGPGGTDKYYDDNAWMVLGFIEADKATSNSKYLQWAKETQAFVLSGWDDKLGGGIYWSLSHQSKNTCDNAPAAVGAFELAELGDTDQKPWGPRIADWVNATLEARDGLYWDNINLNGTITKWKWTYNTGLMIEAELLLYKTQGDQQALKDAERSADAAITTWQDPKTGAFANNASFACLLCESLLKLYRVDHNLRYLNAVRREASFGTRYVYDQQNGGYWNDWKIENHSPGERKSLLENASDARLFWLLASYPDETQLYTDGIRAAVAGKDAQAQNLLQQAADSDTEAVDARYHLWRLLLREHKTAAAQTQEQKLISMSSDPSLKARLTALGWTPPAAMER